MRESKKEKDEGKETDSHNRDIQSVRRESNRQTQISRQVDNMKNDIHAERQ